MPSIKKPSEVTCMVVDTGGLFVDIAVRLSQAYRKVYYCIPYAEIFPFPTGFPAQIGMGIEGIEVVPSVQGEWFDSIDFFFFADTGFSRWQRDLVSRGKIVFGAREGEALELDRPGCKELLRSRGLGVGKYEVVKGLTKLRQYLKDNKRQYVKVNGTRRGLMESFFSESYQMISPKIDGLALALGPSGDMQEFIVEAELSDEDMTEVGTDCLTCDGQYPKKIMLGKEQKDANYIARVMDYDKAPKSITAFNTQTKDVLADCGYRGAISSEVRIGKDKKPYPLDICTRLGRPPSSLYMEVFANFPEACWYLANGKIIDLVVPHPFGVEVIMESEFSNHNWQPIHFPESLTKWISLCNYMIIDKKPYVIPMKIDNTGIGSVIGVGDTLDEAIDMVKEICDQISGHGITCRVESLNSVEKSLEKLDKLGLNFFRG